MAMPPRVARLARSAWTSAAPMLGWRHFHVVGLRRGEDGWLAELAASCDDARRVTVPARALLGQDGWRAGWTPLAELT
jgi:tryptophan-rich hypothetical protein